MKKNATIVSFEGIDGCGKSTQAKKFVKYLKSIGFQVVLFREPGTTAIGNKLRKILLSKKDHISALTELFLYLAARNELVTRRITPIIKKKNVIVLDRFIDSTVAYQGYGRGLSLQLIDIAHKNILKDITPDITFIIDAPSKILRKIVNKNPDRLEKSQKFQEKVRRGYIAISKNEPERIKIIKRKSINETFESIKKCWQDYVNEHPTII
ncbi:MAG: dTMP kinase [Candidatus Omnitrophica bacterium]|nr:dTMP kinase [Candidatus Omnitrophota bacterium]MCM8828423.1 dTMP kinase [Candidatus Omnitrophota bacterium]